MARNAMLALLLPGMVLLGGCAGRRRAAPSPVAAAPAATALSRTPAAIKAGFEASKKRAPYFPLLTQEQAKAAMPPYAGPRDLPTLMLVAGLQPRSMESVMGTARAMRREGGLDAELLNDVFWAVSSANDCFY